MEKHQYGIYVICGLNSWVFSFHGQNFHFLKMLLFFFTSKSILYISIHTLDRKFADKIH